MRGEEVGTRNWSERKGWKKWWWEKGQEKHREKKEGLNRFVLETF